VDWISVKSTTAKGFVGEIETHGSEDWAYVVKGTASNGIYTVTLTGQGKNESFTGTVDQVAKSIAGIILGIDDEV
jgi:hypothetical protein